MSASDSKKYVEDGYVEDGYLADEGFSSLDDLDRQDLQAAIDSTDWTGLAKRVNAKHAAIIREKSVALQNAILQSNADIDTKADACKRVEAVIILLEAPNAPWPEIVRLLNHPSVTAFLAALNLIQFLVELAS